MSEPGPDRLERAALRARWWILAFAVFMFALFLRSLLARAASSALLPAFLRGWLA